MNFNFDSVYDWKEFRDDLKATLKWVETKIEIMEQDDDDIANSLVRVESFLEEFRSDDNE